MTALDDFFGLQTLQAAFEKGDPVAIETLLVRAYDGLEGHGRGTAHVNGRLAALARIIADELLKANTPIHDLSRAHLIMALCPDGIEDIPPADVKMISDLLVGVDIGAHLNGLDRIIKQEFYQEVAVSPLVDSASCDWESPEWTPRRKIDYAQHLADIFCDVLGMPKMVVRGVSIPVYKTKTGALAAGVADVFCNATGIKNPFKKRPVMGFCSQRANGTTVIGLNIDAALGDYEEFHVTLHHEVMHGVHLYLGDMIKNGRASEVPEALLPAAVLLMAMMDPRIYAHSTRTHRLYERFGVETHAERNGLDFARTMQNVYARYQLAERAGFKSALRVGSSAP